MSNENPPCSQCKFYKPQEGNDQLGYCRRFPPTLMFFATQVPSMSGGMELRFPHASESTPVRNDGWCGEHKPAIAIQH